MTNVKNLPTLAELHQTPEIAFKNDQLKTILNNEPPAAWLKKHPYIKSGHHYLPIDKVEFLLDRIFQKWRVEVKQTQQLFNAIQITVRLHYIDPITGEWMFHDGVGAKELQTVKDSGPLKLDFSNVNNGAVEMATPIAKSAAIKDAADHLGKLFGRDLNRKDPVAFTGAYNQDLSQQTQMPNDESFAL